MNGGRFVLEAFFDGSQAQGKWRLTVCAFNDTSPGTIESWSLSFNDTCTEEECPEVYMPDANLRTAVMDTLDLTDPAQLTACTMKDLRALWVALISIHNLTGLEHAANLWTTVFLYDSPITDFSPLRYLPKMLGVYCDGARIDDFTSFVPSPLGSLQVKNTPIKRLDGVEGLVKLDLLLVHGGLLAASGGNNPIAALEDRPTLETLGLESSGVTDIGPLAALTALRALTLKDNAITDVSPLSGLGRLQTLTLDENPLSGISALSTLASLKEVYLNNTGISSLSALTGLRSLETVYAAGNLVTSLSGFNQLGALRKLVVSNNGITDLAPLVSNSGLSSGDMVDVTGNPLGPDALCTQIPQLQARGVTVLFDGTCNGYTVSVQLYGQGSASAVCNYNQSGQYEDTTLTATADAGWRFAWWQGMSAPWNGSVVTYTANTSVTFTGEPRGRTLRAVFVPASYAALDLRADLDALLRKAFPANAPRWYTWDGNGGGTFQPNGIPDGHEFYLLERVLKEGASVVTQAQATEVAVAFYRNQVILRNKLGTRVTAQELNALAAYATLGDSGSIAALSTFIQTTFSFTPAPSNHDSPQFFDRNCHLQCDLRPGLVPPPPHPGTAQFQSASSKALPPISISYLFQATYKISVNNLTLVPQDGSPLGYPCFVNRSRPPWPPSHLIYDLSSRMLSPTHSLQPSAFGLH